MSAFRWLADRVVHRGVIITTVEADFDGPTGTFGRDIVRHPGAVAAVPLDGDEVLLVRQYRPAIDAETLEIPAGLRDVEGEATDETVRRELVEEIGMAAGTLEFLGAFHNSVGFSDEQIHCFVATDLSPVERLVTDSPEEQAMTVVRMRLEDAIAAVEDGRITDAKTAVALLMVDRRRR